jgi:hypothetical protein
MYKLCLYATLVDVECTLHCTVHCIVDYSTQVYLFMYMRLFVYAKDINRENKIRTMTHYF